MIKRVNKIEKFGVFKDYKRTGNIEDFKKLNIIYGWNYSGKTTLSRIIGCFNENQISTDYNQANFEILDNNSKSFNKDNLADYTNPVRVFNSDFLKNNLKWDGETFNPVLLLGEESIEKEKEIEELSKKVDRLTNINGKLKNISTTLKSSIENGLTTKASFITAKLGIVESFTKVQLRPIFNQIKDSYTTYKLSSSQIAEYIISAKMSESDKKNDIQLVNVNLNFSEIYSKTTKLLSETPAFSKTIDFLLENPNISEWVEKGVDLHSEKQNCLYCHNEISETRKNDLLAHFSEDLKKHKGDLNKLLEILEESKINIKKLDSRDFYSSLNIEPKSINLQITEKVNNYNNQIELLKDKVNSKLTNTFTPIIDFSEIKNLSDSISTLVTEINEKYNLNNQYTLEFNKKKSDALKKLKQHYASELIKSLNLKYKESKITTYNNRVSSFELKIKELNTDIKLIEAEISNAQKGREKINEFIHSFLGREEINIEVINENGNEFFTLKRNDDIAKNLSEGEKTAIAFSFFLTKLLEVPNFETSIIYIDDPISSLDSNHIFQVNALIKDFFFKDEENGPNSLKCLQLFLSTHNFEFFNLLRELPLGKRDTEYYFIRRIAESESGLYRLPKAIRDYKSEYHYLFNELYKFHNSANKEDYEALMNIPNSMRRFVELYSYSKIPGNYNSKVDERTDKIFGIEKSKRIMKVLHYFSHSNSINRMMVNSDLLCDIEFAVSDLITELEKDTLHYEELCKSIE